jgi:hypothetical protein
MNQRPSADGAQSERTVLSWNRSGLAIAVNGGLLVREGMTRETPALWIGGALVLSIGVAISCLTVAAAGRGPGHAITGQRLGAVGATLFVVALSIADLTLVVS